jgi:phosphoserine aminotransferase
MLADVANPPAIVLPDSLRPADGRFGCGPSKVRPEAVASLAARSGDWMGTSHRQKPVKDVVGRLRSGLAQLFSLPDGYEVVLGNGGTTAFWDAATFQLVDANSQHLSFGEFSAKFASACAAAPHLGTSDAVKAAAGTAPAFSPAAGIDAYCHPHNETSTGVMVNPQRPEGADGDALVLVDATSGAGGLRVDLDQVDAYYFAPQKCFASDGGLWIALLSPAALERIGRLAPSRWTPAFLDLSIALDNSRLNQTYNTPALATLWLTLQQVEWMNGNGGLEWAAGRSDRSADILYGWAEKSAYAAPFVEKPDERSRVVGTIDLDESVPADAVNAVLRANGVVDTDGYRKLGRNQLRVGMFPAVDPDDVEALTGSIDYVVTQLLTEPTALSPHLEG